MDAEFAAYLDRVRAHRAELRDSIAAVDDALAAPVSLEGAWLERVHAALTELSGDFAEHVALTEGEGGLYASVRASSPRLAGAARRLVDEHRRHAAHLDSLLARLGQASTEDPLALREEVTDLLGQLVRHRQRGSDLVYEAWEVDVGGSD
jgi:hypothetical protein